jgi:hypothetical protein
MSFAAAVPWWWLCAAVPLLWWLSLPARPRRQLWTPHLAQWRAAMAALRRRRPRLSRLRLALLLVAAVLVVLAAGRPQRDGTPGPQRLVVVLDSSASMAAVDAFGVPAFARAQARLRDEFARLPPHVDVAVLRAGGPLLRRHGASARALQDFGPPAGGLEVDLVGLASALAADPDVAVWTLTDGQGQATLPTAGALTVLPADGANASVLAVRLGDQWPLPALDLEVDVVLHAADGRRGTVRVAGAVAAPVEQVVDLLPGERRTLAFALARLPAGGELRVELSVDGDVLPLDDVQAAWLPALPARRIRALVDGDSGPFAAVAAQALAEEIGGAVAEGAPDEDVGFLLVDGGRVDLQPGAARALVFGAQCVGAGDLRPWSLPAVVDWDRAGPLTGGLDLSELRVAMAWHGVLPPGEPFLWADDGLGRRPLAVLVAGDGMASVHFAFRLQDGNLPLLPAFPQLLRRAFVLCHGAAASPSATTTPPAAGELDLRRCARAPDRPLPQFGTPAQDLTGWALMAAALALALRACVR